MMMHLYRFTKSKLMLVGGLFLLLIPMSASAGDVENWVLQVSEEFSITGTNRRIELIYKYLDIYALADIVYPTDFWMKATPDRQRGLVAFLACRIAARMPGGRTGEREIVGVRRSDQGVTVAMRLVDSNQRQETLQFEIVSRSGGYLIRDVRSEKGRLSSRLKSHIISDGQRFFTPPDPDGFLAALTCP